MPTPPATAETEDVEKLGFWSIEDTFSDGDDQLKSEVEACIAAMDFTLDEGIGEPAWLLSRLGCQSLAPNTIAKLYRRQVDEDTALRLALLSMDLALLPARHVLVRDWGPNELIRVVRNTSGEVREGSAEYFG